MREVRGVAAAYEIGMIVRGTLAKYIRPGSVLIETGTREGNTVQTALDLGAALVLSVENQERLYQAATQRFAGNDRVSLFLGSSEAWLPKMIDLAKAPPVFWIDAHTTGKPTPILGELQAIMNHKVRPRAILIDDVRLYRDRRWSVSLGQVIDALKPSYAVHMEDGFVPWDILVAEPLS